VTAAGRIARARSASLAIAVAVAVAAGLVQAQSSAPGRPPQVDVASFDLGLRARELAPGVFVVEGTNADFSPANGCNIINTGFIVTGAGVLVVNTGASRRQGEQLRALIARTTNEPVVRVVHLNLHPDYFLGNQAFADVPRAATAETSAGMAREGAAYATNLYRLCGDWMKGTEPVLPDASIAAGPLRLGEREFELIELGGHTASDLVLVDRRSGVAFVGGLVFADRVPTTPHARLDAWLASLDALEARHFAQIVPSHGPVARGVDGLAQTRRYLRWLDTSFADAARHGLDMSEVLALPVPDEFRRWAALRSEYLRNVAHLYPRYEQRGLQGR
jgi:quinoprotein relay system zinc metallohydrolase 1